MELYQLMTPLSTLDRPWRSLIPTPSVTAAVPPASPASKGAIDVCGAGTRLTVMDSDSRPDFVWMDNAPSFGLFSWVHVELVKDSGESDEST